MHKTLIATEFLEDGGLGNHVLKNGLCSINAPRPHKHHLLLRALGPGWPQEDHHLPRQRASASFELAGGMYYEGYADNVAEKAGCLTSWK